MQGRVKSGQMIGVYGLEMSDMRCACCMHFLLIFSRVSAASENDCGRLTPSRRTRRSRRFQCRSIVFVAVAAKARCNLANVARDVEKTLGFSFNFSHSRPMLR